MDVIKGDFISDIQAVSLATLGFLCVYTLWLSRYRGLDAHITVRWVLVQVVAMLAIIIWRWLPVYTLTSHLQDRELLLLTTVLLFAFVTFLMLDILVRVSKQKDQMKRLVQELAIQRQRIDRIAAPDLSPVQSEPDIQLAGDISAQRRTDGGIGQLFACFWIMICVAFYYIEAALYNSPYYPDFVRRFLTANYLD